jgi:hypothetical protein
MDAPIGSPPTLEWIAVERLAIDESYQRATDSPASRRLINRIKQGWNWSFCQPLVVSRRTDGSLFVIDGQHRLSGAIGRGDIPHLPCVVVTDADEAQTFIALNTQRQKLSQGDIFNAMLAAGDDMRLRLCERHILTNPSPMQRRCSSRCSRSIATSAFRTPTCSSSCLGRCLRWTGN